MVVAVGAAAVVEPGAVVAEVEGSGEAEQAVAVAMTSAAAPTEPTARARFG